ncbi:MAG: hypothetical protein ACKO2C_05885, partial [Actinomycetes bacterium]
PAVFTPGFDLTLEEFGPESLGAADLVVVLVDHPEFDPEVICAHSPLVFDAKAILRGREFRGEVL